MLQRLFWESGIYTPLELSTGKTEYFLTEATVGLHSEPLYARKY